MKLAELPEMDSFLRGPLDSIRSVAPEGMIYAASGTRRAAALAGISTQGDAFAQWTQAQLWRVVNLLFQHGVRHLVMPMLGPSQFDEVTVDYREHLWRWYIEGLAGPEAIAHYQEMGWRVRMACSAYIPQLRLAGERLIEQTPADSPSTLWCFAVPDYAAPTQWLIEAAQCAPSPGVGEIVQALYGEPIPPAMVYLGTGKPLLSTLQLPPLLVRGPLQCYWNQKPGYSLDQHSLRQMIYDYAFLRQTWSNDKTGRAESALDHRAAWETASILGLGTRLGAFWYPAAPV